MKSNAELACFILEVMLLPAIQLGVQVVQVLTEMISFQIICKCPVVPTRQCNVRSKQLMGEFYGEFLMNSHVNDLVGYAKLRGRG